MTKTTTKYHIELTDLFGGEMNYGYINRFTIESVSIRGAISKLSKYVGLNFKVYCTSGYDAIYHSTTKLTGVFIEEFDIDHHSDESIEL